MMNIYEGVFILKATLNNVEKEKLIEEIKGVITKNKGEIIKVDNWGKRRLSYPIKKQSEGLYYLFDFKLVPTIVIKMENTFKLNDLILRTLIIRKECLV